MSTPSTTCAITIATILGGVVRGACRAKCVRMAWRPDIRQTWWLKLPEAASAMDPS
jgi:hypothetical protein